MLALREFDLFHLLDYLALGVAVAAYLVLPASSRNEEWRRHRFEVLRWGVAIALMWSSLEKFAYPEWFYPLVDSRKAVPHLRPAPRRVHPDGWCGGVHHGLRPVLGTPSIRRFSAVALFIIFNAAVCPFGRIDLVGHALIMVIIVAIAVDPVREVHFLPALKRTLAGIPAGLAAALVIFVTGYWGLHIAIYGVAGNAGAPSGADG